MSEESAKDNRTAVQVLLDIEDKVSKVLQVSENINFQYTLVLRELKKQDQVKPVTSSPVPDFVKSTIADKPAEIIQPKQEITSAKRQVRQKIYFPPPINTPVILATVKITDAAGNIINQKIRTDVVGLWKTNLIPGKYQAHIVKPPAGNHPLVEHIIDFTIEPGSDPIELPSPR